MEIGHLIPHIEALIFASDKPLTALELTELINNAFGFMEDKIVLDQVESALEGIVEKYKSEFYPFEVRESGGGWQFLTKKDYHKTVAQLNGDKFLKRLSTAALEALSIIAYKQPVTKAEIEAIRGVSSDYAIQKLLEKELIVITGRNEKLPGHPLVYGTSKNFMDYFGINSPEDLPKLKEVFDDAVVNATNVNEAIAEQASRAAGEEADAATAENNNAVLAVGENGQLIEGTTGTSGAYLNGEAVDFAGKEEAAGEEGAVNTGGMEENLTGEEAQEDASKQWEESDDTARSEEEGAGDEAEEENTEDGEVEEEEDDDELEEDDEEDLEEEDSGEDDEDQDEDGTSEEEKEEEEQDDDEKEKS